MVDREELELVRELAGEIEILNYKIEALVEVLVEKEVIKKQDWDDKIGLKFVDKKEK